MTIFPARPQISAYIKDDDGSLVIVSDPMHDGHDCEPQVITIDRYDIEGFLLALNDICGRGK